MSFMLACKAFFKAFKEPKKAEEFLREEKLKVEMKESDHLRLLTLLQQSGRLVDFFKEDISSFDDAQVGAAVRKIHQDCAKSLEELVTIRPVLQESEGTKISVPAGYDANAIKVVGNVKGHPPYSGILVHRGWKAHKRSLPKNAGDAHTDVISPAEVEIR